MEDVGLRARTNGARKPQADLGAGANLSHPLATDSHPAGPIKHGIIVQILRALASINFFIASCMSINIAQLLGAPMYYWRKDYFYAWMALTKQSFALVMLSLTQWFTPSMFRVSWDPDLRGQFTKTKDGRLETQFPERLVLMANHQIYTEWIYFWWTAYTSRMAGHIYIMLKESLKKLPLLGQGMMFFGFIFMARKWESDKPRIEHRLKQLSTKRDGPTPGTSHYDPMWLLIFPEGTNLSANTRRKSVAWSEKSGKKDLRHCLLPRATGMYFCLQQLNGTVDWVYDCTVGYEGVPADGYAQDYFTLRSTFLQGRPPISVNLYWRRFAIKDIPLDTLESFQDWIEKIWREKDDLLDQYKSTGRFPADTTDASTDGEKEPGYIETKIKLQSVAELGQIFVVAVTLALVANVVVRLLQQFSMLARD